MKVAIPVADGKLAMHFGHCASFALIDIDTAGKTIIGRKDVAAPPHQPGLLPRWLAEHGAKLVIAGGMGQSAQTIFSQQGINVIVGAPVQTPEELVQAYLLGTIQTGANGCDHSHSTCGQH